MDPDEQRPYEPLAFELHEEDLKKLLGNPYHTKPPEHVLEPWTSIWFRPRATIAQILQREDSNKPSIPLAVVIAGIDSTINRASGRGLADKFSPDSFPLGGVLLLLVIGGAIGGLFYWLLMSWLIAVTGRWVGGTGSAGELRLAVGWAMVPSGYNLVLFMLPELCILGSDMFRSNIPWLSKHPEVAIFLLGLIGLSVMLKIWQGVILVKCVAEAHRFSAWRGVQAIVLACLVIMIPIAIVVFIVIAIIL